MRPVKPLTNASGSSISNSIGVGGPVFRSGPPPSEPNRRTSRIRLLQSAGTFGERLADALAAALLNNPNFTKGDRQSAVVMS